MDIKRKKELLALADKFSNSIRDEGCGDFSPKIINSIKIAQNHNDVNFFEKAVKGFKKSSFGGKREKNGYEKFSSKILDGEYSKEIKTLSLDELEFVFSWTRRMKKGR